MTQNASKMTLGFSLSELFFQLQMMAHCGGGHFVQGFSQSELFIQLQMAAHYGGSHFRGDIWIFSEVHS